MHPSKNRVLVIGCNRHFCWSVVTSLGLAGWKSEVVSMPAMAPVRFSRHCTRFTTMPMECQTLTPQRLLEYLRPLIRADHAAVIPVDLPSVLAIGHGLGGLPCPVSPVSPPEVTQLLHDKHRFGQLLQAHGLPIPQTRLIGGTADLGSVDFAFPVMLKPLTGHGSEGIRKFETPAGLREHVATLQAEAFPQLVQQFVPGDLLGLNVLSIHGEVVAWTVQNHGFPGTGYALLRNDRIVEIGLEICRVTGYHGVANFDTIHNPVTGDVRFLECNPRIWASMMPSTWMGVNFPLLALRAALGEDVATQFRPVTGLTQHVRRFPFRMLLQSLLRFRVVPPGLSPPSVAAYRHALSDLLPHILDRFVRCPSPPSAYGVWSEPAVRFQAAPFCPEHPPLPEASFSSDPIATEDAPKPGRSSPASLRRAQKA